MRAEKEEEEDLVRLMEEEGDDMWDCLSQNSLPAAHSAGQHSFRHNSLGKGNTFPMPTSASVFLPRTLSSPSADEDEGLLRRKGEADVGIGRHWVIGIPLTDLARSCVRG